MTIRFSRRAARDVTDILLRGILAFGDQQVSNYQTDLARILALIDANPAMGRVFPQRPGMRTFSFRAHIMPYRIDPDGIIVVRVIDARPDWRGLLG